MRKLAILMIAVFVTSIMVVAGVNAATCPTKSYRARHKVMKTHRVAAKKMTCRTVCKAKKVVKAVPARRGAGPIVNCPKPPAPIVNVPQQAAPIVNVPQQPAPVVNVAPPPPTVGITTDLDSIYIIRGDDLIVLNKSTLCVKKKTTITSSASMDNMGSPAAGTTGTQY